MSLPDPTPDAWTWVDPFTRAFTGPDYTAAFEGTHGSPAVQNGMVVTGNLTASSTAMSRSTLRLAASRWTGGSVQVQYDSQFAVPNTDDGLTPPRVGVRIVGATKTLEWSGTELRWGVDLIATTGLLPVKNTLYRTRITCDVASGRMQIQRGDTGIIDLPLPADWATGMGTGGYVELLHQAVQASGFYLASQASFDNLAVRNGDGTSSSDTGDTGGGGPVPGGIWRFGTGNPDNGLGVNGDVYLDKSTGNIWQRVGGVYVNQTTLIAPKGDKGDDGDPGDPGPEGPEGPPGTEILRPFPILLADATDIDGLILPVTASSAGGLAGAVLTGIEGAACTVEVQPTGQPGWTAVTYPHTLEAGSLRLTRTDSSTLGTVLTAVLGTGTGGSGGSVSLTVTTDADGFDTLSLTGGTP